MKLSIPSGPHRRSTVLFGILLVMIPAVIAFGQQGTPIEPTPVPPTLGKVSDVEIQQFAVAVANIDTIQSEMHEDIAGIIENSELTADRFMEILEALQSLGSANTGNITDGEQLEFDTVIENIKLLQADSQQSMIQAVHTAGLSLERFDEILVILQSDPELAERLRLHLIEEEAGFQTEPS